MAIDEYGQIIRRSPRPQNSKEDSDFAITEDSFSINKEPPKKSNIFSKFFARLSEHNVSDAQVDEIVAEAKNMSVSSQTDIESIQELEDEAVRKKENKEINSEETAMDNDFNPETSVAEIGKMRYKFNPVTGSFEYADKNLQKIHELRQRLHDKNRDPLEAKQSEMRQGLEDIGFSKENIGKTGDSRTGDVTEKHKAIADSQIEDAKAVMLRIRQSQGR